MVNAGAEDNLGAGFTETLLDGIDEVVEIGGRWEDYLHDLGVVTGDAVALDDVRNTLDVRVELLLLAGLQLDLNEGLDMEADLLHVDAGMVASDDAGLLQLRDPCRNRGEEMKQALESSLSEARALVCSRLTIFRSILSISSLASQNYKMFIF